MDFTRIGKSYFIHFGENYLALNIKFVPAECRSPKLPNDKSYFQYTVLDKASRKRFLWFADERSMFESVRALSAATEFFGYAPKEVQTDNGIEFTDRTFAKPGARYAKERPCLFDAFCQRQGIAHKLIRPRTPEHNGKVEQTVQFDPEDGARPEDAGPSRVCKAQGVDVNYGRNQVPKTRTASHII